MDSAVRHSSNGVRSLGKPNNVSSVKTNGTSTVKREPSEKANGTTSVRREPSEKANGTSSVKREPSEKANGTTSLKRESMEKANGSALVKRESSDAKREASTSGVKPIVKKSTSTLSTTTKVVAKKTKTEEKEKKKVFTLPGQKHEPPEERDSLRIFYETLHEQRPDSEMAEFWMMEHGLLSPERAKKAFEKKQKRGNSSFGTPTKNSTPSRDSSKVVARTSMSNGKASASASKVTEQKGKRKWESDSDDELLIARPLKRKLKT